MNFDILSEKEINRHLQNPKQIIVKEKTESTNLDIKRLAENGAEAGTVVVAEAQSKGRGRVGRSFYSPKGFGIYMSVLLKPNLENSDIVLLTTAVSVGVCRGIEKAIGKKPQIKWVNDLYLSNKKICGILTEAVRDSSSGEVKYIIVGIGINCMYQSFPEDIAEIAGSIGEEGEEIPRNKIIAEIIKEFDLLEKNIKDRSFLIDYKERSMVIGKKIRILNDNQTGEAVDIDQNGGLIVKTDTGEMRTLSSGEISIRIDGNNRTDK